MSEVFSAIYVKVKIGDTWVDVSDDVLATPEPRVSGMGIMGYSPTDRVGSSATFTFSLNNSESNSVRTRGYYSPDTANSLTGWTTGLYVRLYFLYDGIYSCKFYGKIAPDGIQVESGIYNRRAVHVTAYNWMREADNQTANLLTYQTNKRGEETLALTLDNVTNRPLATSYQNGTRTFPTIFDITKEGTKISSELQKIAMSELGLIYIRGDHGLTDYVGGETLVFENRTYRYNQRNAYPSIPLHSSEPPGFLLMESGDYLLLETSDKIILEASQEALFSESDIRALSPKYGEHIYNRAKLTAYPRRVDASTVVLWTLESPIMLAPNQVVDGVRGAYRDPNSQGVQVSGINMVTPVSGTDYAAYANEDGTGTNLTANLSVTVEYGSAEAEYTLQNTGASTMYVTLLQARGNGVYIYDSASVQYESASSIAAYGVNEINIDMPYVSSASDLFSGASQSLDLALMETGDKLLLEDGNFMRLDDESGIFDLLISDVPQYWLGQTTFAANRNKFNMLAFMTLDAGSFIRISDTMTGVTNENTYFISGYDLGIRAGGIVEWSPVLVSSLQYPKI